MGRFALDFVARHFPALPRPLSDAVWTVLLEHSDTEGETQARARFETLLGQALEAGIVADAVVAESLAQSRAVACARIDSAGAGRGRTEHQARHLAAGGQHPGLRRAHRHLLQERFPGVRLVNFGHLGDGNLHCNVQAPPAAEAGHFLREHEHKVNTLVFDALQPFGGSFSAEHGIGALKRDELALRNSPVALLMMRAIKSALERQGLMSPGRVL